MRNTADQLDTILKLSQTTKADLLNFKELNRPKSIFLNELLEDVRDDKELNHTIKRILNTTIKKINKKKYISVMIDGEYIPDGLPLEYKIYFELLRLPKEDGHEHILYIILDNSKFDAYNYFIINEDEYSAPASCYGFFSVVDYFLKKIYDADPTFYNITIKHINIVIWNQPARPSYSFIEAEFYNIVNFEDTLYNLKEPDPDQINDIINDYKLNNILSSYNIYECFKILKGTTEYYEALNTDEAKYYNEEHTQIYKNIIYELIYNDQAPRHHNIISLFNNTLSNNNPNIKFNIIHRREDWTHDYKYNINDKRNRIREIIQDFIKRTSGHNNIFNYYFNNTDYIADLLGLDIDKKYKMKNIFIKSYFYSWIFSDLCDIIRSNNTIIKYHKYINAKIYNNKHYNKTDHLNIPDTRAHQSKHIFKAFNKYKIENYKPLIYKGVKIEILKYIYDDIYNILFNATPYI